MNNYHTHTSRCRHAYGKDRDYVEKAIKVGIKTLGFSDHAPMLFPDDNYYSSFRMYKEDVEDYVNSINLLRKEYSDRIDIHLGYEIEYYPELFDKTIEFLGKFGYEYLILGQHFTDNEYEPYSVYCVHKTKSEEIFDKYIDQALTALKTGKFLYIAHPDLINYQGDDEIYKAKMTEFCKEIKALGYPLEFNLLGYVQHRNYPDKRFWEIASDVGNDVLIGFDAHSPDAFRNKKIYNDALKYLKKLDIVPVEIEMSPQPCICKIKK